MGTLLAAMMQSCEDRATARYASLILCGVNCISEPRLKAEATVELLRYSRFMRAA